MRSLSALAPAGNLAVIQHLFVGNSHANALQHAWFRRLGGPDGTGHQITSLLSPGTSLALKRNGTRLEPSNDKAQDRIFSNVEGLTSVDCADFDMIWVIGLGFAMTPVMDLVGNVRSATMDHRPAGLALVSQQALRELCRSVMRRSVGAQTLRVARAAAECPVGVVTEPLPAEQHAATRKAWQTLSPTPDAQIIQDHWVDSVLYATKSLADVVHFPDPVFAATPLLSHAEHLFPLEDFPDDFRHLNLDYGEHMMTNHVLPSTVALLATTHNEEGTQ